MDTENKMGRRGKMEDEKKKRKKRKKLWEEIERKTREECGNRDVDA